MTRGKSRLEELRERWERNRQRGYVRGHIINIPSDMADMRYRGLERPQGLRAIDVVQELERLALEWGDPRCADAVRALRELGIVNERGGFSRNRGPHATSLEASAMDYAITRVYDLINERNISEREACAM